MYRLLQLIDSKPVDVYLMIGCFISPIIIFLQKYVFDDWHFVLNMLIVIFIDTCFGFIWAYKRGRINSHDFGKVLSKVLTYMLLLVAVHNVSHFQVNGKVNVFLTWLDSVVYATIMAREMLSIFEKTALLGYFKPPKWIIGRLSMLNEQDPIENKNENSST
jgi:hypothetical protein